jgi:hypothetical protein
VVELNNTTQENKTVVNVHEKMFVNILQAPALLRLTRPLRTEVTFREACWLVAWLFSLAFLIG